MPPSVRWGFGVGALIAAIDTVTLVLGRQLAPSAELIQSLDLLANVVLYTLVGIRVARTTGVVRDAAEAGVFAAILVAGCAIAVSAALGPPAGGSLGTNGVLDVLAMNVALGGLLSIAGGWIGRRQAEASL